MEMIVRSSFTRVKEVEAHRNLLFSSGVSWLAYCLSYYIHIMPIKKYLLYNINHILIVKIENLLLLNVSCVILWPYFF